MSAAILGALRRFSVEAEGEGCGAKSVMPGIGIIF
jgi:hypothetical protein